MSIIGEGSAPPARQPVPSDRAHLFRNEVSEHRKRRLHGEIVLSQPLSTRLAVGALFTIIAIATSWVSLGSYARIETVPGILTTDIPSAKVVATTPGVVIKLHAVEGQLISAGDRLVVINLDRRAAAGETVASRGIDALTERQQLTETQIGLSLLRTTAERARLETSIASAREQIASLAKQIALQEQIVASNDNLFDQIAEVVERGFISKVEFERRRQTLIGSQQQLAGLHQQHSELVANAAQAKSQIHSLMAQSDHGVSEIRSSLHAMAQQRAQLEGEQGYIITAPISGRVTTLQTAAGRTANPNVPLMTIVPEKSGLKAELYAPTRAVGFVEPGQEARILYDAFPYQRFGSFGGKVQSVSRIVIDPRESDVPLKLEEAVFRVTVRLDRQHVVGYGKDVALQPGMTLKANIVLERQSFLSWLLQPLNAVLKRSS